MVSVTRAVSSTAVENGNIGTFLHSILKFANHPQWRKTKFLQSIVHRFNFICLFSFHGVTNSSFTCFLLFVSIKSFHEFKLNMLSLERKLLWFCKSSLSLLKSGVTILCLNVFYVFIENVRNILLCCM